MSTVSMETVSLDMSHLENFTLTKPVYLVIEFDNAGISQTSKYARTVEKIEMSTNSLENAGG